MEKCCGTCTWHEHESIDDGWVCTNGYSDYCADWTDHSFRCDEWEGELTRKSVRRKGNE